ncbi:hypothetical protein RND81_12G132600 [Saponaria officinalis]|uniref:Uncharacterized protein n=1 Tax=Saponaria officinalis TaxID=3572 RepID=A0AAW1HA05_SAPOF
MCVSFKSVKLNLTTANLVNFRRRFFTLTFYSFEIMENFSSLFPSLSLQISPSEGQVSVTTRMLCLCCVVGHEIRDKFSGDVDAFARRNAQGSSSQRDHSHHRSLDSPPSKDMQSDLDRARSSRNGSTSKRALISISRPSSSGEHSDGRSERMLSTSGRVSTTQDTNWRGVQKFFSSPCLCTKTRSPG